MIVMAAPQLGVPRYSDGSTGEPLTATALRTRLTEGAVQWISGGNYREVSTRRTFRLVCARCRHNQCGEGSQRIIKLGQTWTWASYFVHNTLSDHQADCVCVLGAGGGGGTSRKRRFLEHRVFIPTKRAYPEGNLPLLIEFRKPETTSGYLKTWFQTRRMPAIDNIDLVPSFSHDEEILACGKVTGNTLNRTSHDFDTGHPIYWTKQFDFHDLESRCWHMNFEGLAAEPLPAKVDHINRMVRIQYPQNTSGKFYFAATQEVGAREGFTALPVDAPIFGGHLLKIGDDFSALLKLFKRACEDAGYDLQYNDPKMDFRLFEHDQRTRFLYVKNRADEEKIVDLRALEVGSIGSEQMGELDPDEYIGDFVGTRESRQFKEVRVPPNTTLLKRVRFRGNVRFEIHVDQRKVFTDIINAGTALAAVDVDESTTLLRSEFLSLVRASYPEYQPLQIDAEDEEVDLQKMDWVDFDRFMFSRTLRTGDEEVAPQGITLRNSLLLSLLTSFNEQYHDQQLEESSTLDRFSEMFESKYEPVVEETLEDEFGDLMFNTKHRLVETETYGWFGPDESEYKWLIDRRSWSQLLEDNPDLVPDDVVFLPSGHRLIRSAALNRYDKGRIQAVEHFNQFRDSPYDTIEHAFDFTSASDAKQKYANLERTIDAGAHEFVFNPRATAKQNFAVWSNMNFQSVLPDVTPWDRHGEPQIALINGVNYSLHRLTRQMHDDLMTHGFYIVKQTDNAESGAVGIFRAFFNIRPDSVSKDKWATMTHRLRVFAHWQALRTHLRAFTGASLGGTLPIGEVDAWKPLLDFATRRFLFGRQDVSSPFEEMQEYDTELSQHIKAYMLKCMWIE